jgi:hypothetical protein
MQGAQVYIVEEPEEIPALWRDIFAFTPAKNLVRFSSLSGLGPVSLRKKNLECANICIGFDNYLLAILADLSCENIYWISRTHGQNYRKTYFHIQKNESEFFLARSADLTSTASTLHELSLQEISSMHVPPCVLEVHLSFFSSLRRPIPRNARIEVTEIGAREYLENPYHALRLFSGAKTHLVKDNGKFFLECVHQEFPILEIKKASQETLAARVQECIQGIKKMSPSHIFLCREFFSARVPEDQGAEILSLFFEQLATIMPYTLCKGGA